MNMNRYWMLVWFIIGVTVGLLIPTQARAQQICGDREKMMAKLAVTYLETPKHIALATSGNVVEVFVSAKGTWTMLITAPGGPTCAMGIGEAWEDLPWLPPEEGQGT